jgi:hypothetical protein
VSYDDRLFRDVSQLVDAALERANDADARERLLAARERMHAPLRVAIAGQVKAGKSTLLNALVGEELAATDAAECTLVVTWYRHGLTRRVTCTPTAGSAPVEIPFVRTDHGIDIDLGGRHPSDVDRLDVEWPSSALASMHLIDTPGTESTTGWTSERTRAFLAIGDEDETEADAVVYLMRHVHTADVDFLEAFRDDRVSQAAAINTLAVLARADEIGVGRLDSMQTAQQIAGRYVADVRLRRLVTTVVPVAALVAQAGASLSEAMFGHLRQVAALDDDIRTSMLLSADRFLAAPLVPEPARRDLLERFGMFGLRVSIDRIVSGRAATATQLAQQLVDLSGLEQLRAEITKFFAGRAAVLKARSALLALEHVAGSWRRDGETWLDGELERVLATAHEFAELQLLTALRAGSLSVSDDERDRMERLLGVNGVRSAERLGLGEATPDSDLSTALHQELARWQRRAANPMSDRDVVQAATILTHTCEALLTSATSEH